VPTSGKGSSRKSIRFPAPFVSSVGVAALTPGEEELTPGEEEEEEKEDGEEEEEEEEG